MPSQPRDDQVEVSLFGPGFGECTLIHVGDGRWLVIDSCVDPETGRAVALRYLHEIGANASAIELIVATHWHDDHVRGLAQIVAAYPSARVCVSTILTNQEFVGTILAHDDRPMTKVSSGVREMRRILELRRGKEIVRGVADKRVLRIPGSELSHGHDVEVWTLSPCDASLDRFLHSLKRIVPEAGAQKQRVPSITPNECSVVMWISIGPLSLLLGADLEEHGGCGGWSAILASTGRPQSKASFFKVPHHGSANAHHPDVWRHMLVPDALFALAPYDRGKKLPAKEDVQRLTEISENGYTTATLAKRSEKRKGTVGKIIKEFNIDLTSISASAGQVRGRADVRDAEEFELELLRGARPLRETY